VTEAALPDPTPVPSLAVMAVLRDTARLYRDLFGRTVLTGLIVFGVVAALETVASAPVIFLSVIGTALVQGALVEAVAAEHESREQGTILDLYRVRGHGSGGYSASPF
jgi:hypothetical protein